MLSPIEPRPHTLHPIHDPQTALSLFSGDLTDDTLTAHLKTLHGDPDWRVFVFGGPTVCDVELIYKRTNAWYILTLKKVRRVRGAVWRRTS